MFRFFVCLVTLAAFVTGLGHMLAELSKSMHVWSFMVICGALSAVVLALAFGWDRVAHKRQPQRPAA